MLLKQQAAAESKLPAKEVAEDEGDYPRLRSSKKMGLAC